ncbi:MAG: radical SAM protein [bacterium]
MSVSEESDSIHNTEESSEVDDRRAPGAGTDPIPGLEWHISDVCNYRCEYCCERQFDPSRPHLGMMPDDLVERVLEMTSGLPGRWHTKFGHGEPTLHPRFVEVAGRLCEQGHQVGFVTNFP